MKVRYLPNNGVVLVGNLNAQVIKLVFDVFDNPIERVCELEWTRQSGDLLVRCI